MEQAGPKQCTVVSVVEDALKASDSKVRFSQHAEERIEQRIRGQQNLTVRDVFRILRKGRRAEEHDEWNFELKRWSYAFAGVTVDGIRLRVCVALVEPGILVVTIICPGNPDEF